MKQGKRPMTKGDKPTQIMGHTQGIMLGNNDKMTKRDDLENQIMVQEKPRMTWRLNG